LFLSSFYPLYALSFYCFFCSFFIFLFLQRDHLQPSKRLGRFGVNSHGSGFLATLDLFRFVPFRLNRLAAEVSAALSGEYQERYGLDIPEWRVLATLGFRDEACSAQYIAHCTRTHKSHQARGHGADETATGGTRRK